MRHVVGLQSVSQLQINVSYRPTQKHARFPHAVYKIVNTACKSEKIKNCKATLFREAEQ